MNVTLFQIYHKPEQLQNIFPGVVPWDNSQSKVPQLREFPVFEMEYYKQILQGDSTSDDCDSYWGFISAKFHEKTNIMPEKFIDWIKNHPGFDAYFINPCPIQEALWPNVIEHGEHWHPGLKNLLNEGLRATRELVYQFETNLMDNYNMRMDNTTFAFCNYFVANKKFWRAYIEFVQRFIRGCETNAELRQRLYYGNAKYNRDQSLPYYSFAIERLFSIFRNLYPQMPTWAYQYSYEEQKHKMTRDQFNELAAISKVKRAAVSGNYVQLWDAWELFRYNFNLRNPELFNKE